MEKIVEINYTIMPILFICLIIFLLYKNKDIIKFNKLKLPKVPYLKGVYLSGLNYKSGNMYITKDKDAINIAIENKDGIFYDEITNVSEIKVTVKPYNYVKEVPTDYEVDYAKSENIGRVTGDCSYKNKIKVIKSYELNIITNDRTINLVVFKDPNKFL